MKPFAGRANSASPANLQQWEFAMADAPKLWKYTRYLPRSWQRALLEALAWPAYEVRRAWFVIDHNVAGGVRVDHLTLAEADRREAMIRADILP